MKQHNTDRFTSRTTTRLTLFSGFLVVTAALLIAATPATAAPPYKSVYIDNIPHVKQKPDFCGEACAEMVLTKLGKKMDQDFVFDASGLDPRLGRGCYTKELYQALKKIGFKVGTGGYTVDARTNRSAVAGMTAQFDAMHADLVRGIPSIICMHYDDRPNTTEHFRLIIGYDAATDEVIYHEPAHADAANERMKRDMLIKLWPLKYQRTKWTVIRLRLEPGRLIEGESSSSFTAADYAVHIHGLKKRLPHDKFHIVLQPPFVVVGDQSQTMVRRHATQTVQWTVDRIKRQYFKKDPDEIIDVWLFKDTESYEKHNLQLFSQKPTTPYGYYSPTHNVLVMNISTGGGTLVHEIVHPFMASNFPACPAWFNEGLASLYEQSSTRGGKIWGLTNWRLGGLQTAITDRRVPSFKTLCSTTTEQFYNQDPGTNYSQARYLCYYLQERGLLNEYYHQCRANSQQDPTGYETLKRVLAAGREPLSDADMATFKVRWEKYVASLRF